MKALDSVTRMQECMLSTTQSVFLLGLLFPHSVCLNLSFYIFCLKNDAINALNKRKLILAMSKMVAKKGSMQHEIGNDPRRHSTLAVVPAQ